jgi:hypothetical protein
VGVLERLVLPPPETGDCSWQRGAVREVVQERPEARPGEIARREQIGEQDRGRNQPPRLAGAE